MRPAGVDGYKELTLWVRIGCLSALAQHCKQSNARQASQSVLQGWGGGSSSLNYQSCISQLTTSGRVVFNVRRLAAAS